MAWVGADAALLRKRNALRKLAEGVDPDALMALAELPTLVYAACVAAQTSLAHAKELAGGYSQAGDQHMNSLGEIHQAPGGGV